MPILRKRNKGRVSDTQTKLQAIVGNLANNKTHFSIIAVHGLSGHAFGSWATFNDHSGQFTMWLKDFLPEDVQNVRILTYGYESRLDKTTTMSRLLDYRRAFLREVVDSRGSVEVLPRLSEGIMEKPGLFVMGLM